MKTLFTVSLLSLAAAAFAGTPLDQGATLAGSYSHANIIGNTATGSTTVAAAGSAYQNCFTRITAQLSSSATFYLLDGSTTDYVIYGQGLGTSGTSTISLPEDHLGPLCLTAGVTTTFNVQPNSGANVVNYEGFSNGGPYRN